MLGLCWKEGRKEGCYRGHNSQLALLLAQEVPHQVFQSFEFERFRQHCICPASLELLDVLRLGVSRDPDDHPLEPLRSQRASSLGTYAIM